MFSGSFAHSHFSQRGLAPEIDNSPIDADIKWIRSSYWVHAFAHTDQNPYRMLYFRNVVPSSLHEINQADKSKMITGQSNLFAFYARPENGGLLRLIECVCERMK